MRHNNVTCFGVMMYSAIVSKMAETEIDYMIQQLVETRVSVDLIVYKYS